MPLRLLKKVALIGNPNCGKTTLFNALTGSHQHVGNWAGVTVEKKSGFFDLDHTKVEVVDLPGVYSLSGASSESEDEHVTRNFLLFEKVDCIINVIDASNIERHLYITVQLLEMGLPVLIVLNMMDVASQNNIKIDVLALAQTLNVPVIPLIASKPKTVMPLKQQIVHAHVQRNFDFFIHYPIQIEPFIQQLKPLIGSIAQKHNWTPRWLAVHILDGDTDFRLFGYSDNNKHIRALRDSFQETCDEDADTLIADGRYGYINEISRLVVSRTDLLSQSVTDWIDRIALGRFTGIPCFLIIMYVMFLWTIGFGGMLIDPIARIADIYLVENFALFLKHLNTPEWLVILLASGVGRGVSTVATFIPPIGFLFLFLSALEDSGYMARGAFVMDKLTRSLGLPGTAFVPMIVAFGCTVPAIMGTRTLSSLRDRLITLTMTPFMSCGARLPVYALFATAFFPSNGQNIVFLLYIIGIVMALVTGFVMKSTVLKGELAPLILEIPPYHLPTLKNILYKTWDRLKGFIVRAGALIVPLVIILNLLNSFDFKINAVPEGSEYSMLSVVGKAITPVLSPMGVAQNNWPATVGLITGVMAKEAIIGSLDALYATQSGVNSATERLVYFFGGQANAFAYLLFVLLYVPCFAALGAILKEFGSKWVLFTVFWTTAQAFMVSTLFYQIAVFTKQSIYWIVFICTLEIVTYVMLRFYSNKENHNDSR